jgi:hypothetical protein
VSFHINFTDGMVIPVGLTSDRPAVNVTGTIRYNNETSQFEGYGISSWGSLGGIIDVDQDTKITAEDSAGIDNDQLKFFTLGAERMIIENNGNVGIGVLNPSDTLVVNGSFNVFNQSGVGSFFYVNQSTGFVGVKTVSPTAGLTVGDGLGNDFATGGNDLYVEGDLEVDGSVWLGDNISVDNLNVQSSLNVSGLLIFSGDLDMQNQIISNVGSAGTDFLAGGGLVLASALTVSAGGASISGGLLMLVLLVVLRVLMVVVI